MGSTTIQKTLNLIKTPILVTKTMRKQKLLNYHQSELPAPTPTIYPHQSIDTHQRTKIWKLQKTGRTPLVLKQGKIIAISPNSPMNSIPFSDLKKKKKKPNVSLGIVAQISKSSLSLQTCQSSTT